jgi:hypothetical protein
LRRNRLHLRERIDNPLPKDSIKIHKRLHTI